MTTDTSKAPERIWATPYDIELEGGTYCESWHRPDPPNKDATKYVRADILDAMQARAEKAEAENERLLHVSKSERLVLKALKEGAEAERDSLRAENERLREALSPFAEYMQTDEGRLDRDNHGNDLPDNDGVGWVYLTHGDFRAARAALERRSINVSK